MRSDLSKVKSIVAAVGFFLFAIYAVSEFSSVSASAAPEILRGHTNSVSSVAVSADGSLIASASLDHTVRLWDARTGKTILVLSGHKEEVYAAAFSPDNQTLASSDYDGRVIIWSVKSGKPLRTLEIKGWSTAIAFSPDGNLLAVANQEPGTNIYDVKNGNVVRTIETTGYTNAIAFSPDGRYLATARGAIGLWDLQTGKVVKRFEGHQGSIKAVAFSKDGRFLASASNDKTARVWNVETVENTKTFQTLTPIAVKYSTKPFEWKMPFTSVAFSPDGKTLAAATGRTVHLFDIATGKQIKTLEGHELSITSVVFSPDGKSIVSGSLDNTVRVWSFL